MRFRRSFLRGFAFVMVLAGLAIGGWLWLRDSSLVAVTAVRVTGATSSDEARIRSALESAARDMTTLHVRDEVLHEAVTRYHLKNGVTEVAAQSTPETNDTQSMGV